MVNMVTLAAAPRGSDTRRRGTVGPALRHRVVLRTEAEIEDMTPDAAVREIVDTVPVPR